MHFDEERLRAAVRSGNHDELYEACLAHARYVSDVHRYEADDVLLHDAAAKCVLVAGKWEESRGTLFNFLAKTAQRVMMSRYGARLRDRLRFGESVEAHADPRGAVEARLVLDRMRDDEVMGRIVGAIECGCRRDAAVLARRCGLFQPVVEAALREMEAAR